MSPWGYLIAGAWALALAGAYAARNGWAWGVVAAGCCVAGLGLLGLAAWRWRRDAGRPWCRTTLRVRVLGAWGRRARFEAGCEARPFSMWVTRQQARELRGLVGEEVDLELSHGRDARGTISGGRVYAIHRLQDDASGESWRRFFEEAGRAWEGVPCVACELGRRCETHPHSQCAQPCPGTWPECEEADAPGPGSPAQ